MELLPEEIVVYHIASDPDTFVQLVTLSRHFRDMLLPYFPRLIKKWLPRTAERFDDARFPSILGEREFDNWSIGMSCVIYSSRWTAGKHKGKLHGEYKIVAGGKVFFAVNYRFDILHGKFIALIDTKYFGEVRKLTGQFIRGKKDGIVRHYYLGHLLHRLYFADGQKIKVETFKDRSQRLPPIPEVKNKPFRVIDFTYHRFYKVVHEVEYRKNGSIKFEKTYNAPHPRQPSLTLKAAV